MKKGGQNRTAQKHKNNTTTTTTTKKEDEQQFIHSHKETNKQTTLSEAKDHNNTVQKDRRLERKRDDVMCNDCSVLNSQHSSTIDDGR